VLVALGRDGSDRKQLLAIAEGHLQPEAAIGLKGDLALPRIRLALGSVAP